MDVSRAGRIRKKSILLTSFEDVGKENNVKENPPANDNSSNKNKSIVSPEELLDALDSLVESNFSDVLTSTIIKTNESLHLSIWKQLTKTREKEVGMTYLPLFYIICCIKKDLKLSMKLITHHGKILEELDEKECAIDDQNKIKFVGKLCTARLCPGVLIPEEDITHNLERFRCSFLLEQMEDKVIRRSRQCEFAIYDSSLSICSVCQAIEKKTLILNKFDRNNDADSQKELYSGEHMMDGDDDMDSIVKSNGDDCDNSKTYSKETEIGNIADKENTHRLSKKLAIKNIFKCKHCAYETNKKESMANHIITNHLKRSKVYCEYCDFTSFETKALSMHFREVHNIDYYYVPRMDEQKESEIPAKEFKCTECDYSTIKRLLFKRHKQTVHKDKSKHCTWPECSYKTNRSDRMIMHIANVHEKVEKPFPCEQCHFAFAERKGLERHVNAVHKRIKPYLCTMCSFQTAYKETLNLHINTIHHNLRPFLCPQCDFKAPYQKVVNQHIRTVHEKYYPFKCNQCSYEAARKNQVTKHIRSIHEGIKPITCDFCDYRTDTKWHLVQHVSVKHNTDKPYKCTECSYQAARKNYLTDHIRSVHEKIRKFKCDQCSYQTTSNSSLTKHVCSAHNQPKPFSCQQCPFEGMTKISLMKHINEAHSNNSNISIIKVINIVKTTQ